MKKKLLKTIIQVEILSEEPLTGSEDLNDIHYEITNGSWSGAWDIKSSSTLVGQVAVDAVLNQGSSPDFFSMDEEGNEMDW